MLNKIKTYLQFGNRFCGIEHTIKSNSKLIIVTVLKKSKNELIIENYHETSNLDNLTNKLPKKQHIHLTINNVHVLTKRIENNTKDNLKLLYNSFPNIKIDDFYYELIQQENIQFINICRKDYVDKLITKYRELGFSIINFSLGNSLTSSISEYIKSKESITTSNAIITRQNNTITSIEKNQIDDIKKYNINGLIVNSNQLLSFSGALQSVLKLNPAFTNYEDQKKLLLNEYNSVRFFSQFLKFSGLFLLAVLLINFIFFNHYFNEVNTLQQTSQINQTTKDKILILRESVSKTQKTVDDMLKSNTSKSSFYTNSIIQSLPSSIILSELNYQPLEKRIKADKPISLQNNIIIVSGNSNSSDLFSNWISEIETLDWVSSLETISYGNLLKSKSIFSIKININNDL